MTLPYGFRGQLTIGLMGGSFNPAHGGHRHISEIALRTLGLDELWWMVSPQNPLKPVEGMAAFHHRFAYARAVGNHPRIRVSDIESRLGTQYTAETLAELQKRYPTVRFIWIMGADNLAQIHRWDSWEDIFGRVGIAVFDRPAYSLRALSSKAAKRFAKARLAESKARLLA